MWPTIKQFFTRAFQGSKLSLISFSAYYHYKKLLIFPVLAAAGITAVCMTVFVAFFFLEPWLKTSKYHEIFGAVVIAVILFFLVALINAFFKVATAKAVGDYCEAHKTSILSACAQSMKKLPVILPWAALEGLIKLAAGSKEKGSESSLTQFVLGTSWHYLSFFVYPVFAFEKTSFFGSLKRSAQLTKKYFGTITGSLITFSVVQWLVIFGILGLLFGFMYVVGSGFDWLMAHTGHPIEEKTFMAVFVIPFTLWTIFTGVQIILTAQAIMSTLIYRHLNGQSTGFLSHETLEKALQEIK